MDGAAPDPGIYPGVPEHIYRSWPVVSQTSLKNLGERSPMHARYWLINPEIQQSQAKDVGRAAHYAILEPDRLEQEFVGAQYDGNTKEGRAEIAEIKASGRIRLRASEWESVLTMRDAVRNHPEASKLLHGAGRNEVSLVWDESVEDLIDPEEAGEQRPSLRCKARIDRLVLHNDWPIAVDLKKTQDAREESFRWAIGRYGYHIQAALYLRGLRQLQFAPWRFVFVAIEEKAPHGISVLELDEPDLMEADRQLDVLLAAWWRCEKSGRWPGYPTGIRRTHLPEKFWRTE